MRKGIGVGLEGHGRGREERREWTFKPKRVEIYTLGERTRRGLNRTKKRNRHTLQMFEARARGSFSDIECHRNKVKFLKKNLI